MSKGTLATAEQGGTLQAFLEGQQERVAAILPPNLGLSPERVIKLACLTIHKSELAKKKNPKARSIADCTRISILSSILEASSLGLEIGGALAEAHLVPFGTECTMLPDYKGLLKLARQSGEFDVIEAVEVFERDHFRVFRAPAPSVQHELCLEDDPGEIRFVYAYATLKGGNLVFEIMSRAQVEKIRLKSRSADSPAWRDHWGEMAKKVVLKRFLKRQGRSLDVAKAIEADNRDYVLDQPQIAHASVSKRGVAGVRSSLGLEPSPASPPPADVDSPAELEPYTDDYPDEPGSEG